VSSTLVVVARSRVNLRNKDLIQDTQSRLTCNDLLGATWFRESKPLSPLALAIRRLQSACGLLGDTRYGLEGLLKGARGQRIWFLGAEVVRLRDSAYFFGAAVQAEEPPH
jgi:hypothetical protein